MRLRAVLLVGGASLLVVGVLGGAWALQRGDGSEPDAVPASSAVPLGPVLDPAPAPRRCLARTTRAVGSATTAVGLVVDRPVVAQKLPGGAAISRFARTNVNGVRTVFGVLAEKVGPDCRPRWYHVQLPLRPNGTTGWVAARGVRPFVVHTRVVVDLSDREVTAYRDGRVVLRVAAAIGKPETPTPTGRFYVNQRLLAADPTGPWGPGGVGVSAFSPVLVSWTQGGPIAIHGTNQPYLIGEAVSNGCVRISNFHLKELMDIATEGTPVLIRS